MLIFICPQSFCQNNNAVTVPMIDGYFKNANSSYYKQSIDVIEYRWKNIAKRKGESKGMNKE